MKALCFGVYQCELMSRKLIGHASLQRPSLRELAAGLPLCFLVQK